MACRGCKLTICGLPSDGLEPVYLAAPMHCTTSKMRHMFGVAHQKHCVML